MNGNFPTFLDNEHWLDLRHRNALKLTSTRNEKAEDQKQVDQLEHLFWIMLSTREENNSYVIHVNRLSLSAKTSRFPLQLESKLTCFEEFAHHDGVTGIKVLIE